MHSSGGDPLDAERLGKVAARLGATTAQIAIVSLLAIPGNGSLDHLEENLAANDLSLTDQDSTDLLG